MTINDSPVQQSIESKFDKQGIREGSLPRQDILEEFECWPDFLEHKNMKLNLEMDWLHMELVS